MSGKLWSAVLIAAVAVMPVTLLSCSSGGGGGGDDPTVNVTGIWSGTFSTSLIWGILVLDLSQSGSSVTGTFYTDEAWGTVSGTVSGNTLHFNITETVPGCSGSFSGNGSVSGNTMSLTFSGSDCLGSHNNGQGTVTKI